MTNQELRDERDKAERLIAEALVELQRKTGLRVTHLDLQAVVVNSLGGAISSTPLVAITLQL